MSQIFYTVSHFYEFLFLPIQDIQIYLSPLNFRLLAKKMTDFKSIFLPAHAHRHERHDKVVVCQMNRIHIFRVKFLSSPGFPGLGFGTVPRRLADWLPGFLRA